MKKCLQITDEKEFNDMYQQLSNTLYEQGVHYGCSIISCEDFLQKWAKGMDERLGRGKEKMIDNTPDELLEKLNKIGCNNNGSRYLRDAVENNLEHIENDACHRYYRIKGYIKNNYRWWDEICTDIKTGLVHLRKGNEDKMLLFNRYGFILHAYEEEYTESQLYDWLNQNCGKCLSEYKKKMKKNIKQ